MKNACIAVVLGMALMSFFSFTNNREVSLQDEDAYSQDNFVSPDTVPHKKDTTKTGSKTTPYDSFGKPKKMDSARL